MEAIVELFKRRTPPELIWRHRTQLLQSAELTVNALYRFIDDSTRNSTSPLAVDFRPNLETFFVSGSGAEGANLARLFSDDKRTSQEAEFDVMLQFETLTADAERTFRYVPDNQAFLHIHVSPENRSALDEGYKSSLSIRAEDGQLYRNSLAFKEALDAGCLMAQPALQNFVGGRPVVSEPERRSAVDALGRAFSVGAADQRGSHDGPTSTSRAECRPMGQKASVQMGTSYGDPKSSECARKTAAEQSMVANYERIVSDMEDASGRLLRRFRAVEDELAAALDACNVVPLRVQASKAEEYIRMCVDISNTILDAREALVNCTAKELFGLPVEQAMAPHRERVMTTLNQHLDRLRLPLDDDETLESTERTVRDCLAEVDRKYVSSGDMFVTFQTDFLQFFESKNLLEFAKKKDEEIQNSTKWNNYHEHLAQMSLDLVPCIRLQFWPSVAGDWLTRERQWPDAAAVDAIARKGVHIIGKQFCHPDIDWRLSFSVAEIELAKLWTESQLFVYFVFKSLFYMFVKATSKEKVYDRRQLQLGAADDGHDSLPSYVAKTAMMHACEAFPQSWWSTENAAECLQVLLGSLQSALESRRLDHYFIPSVNVLGRGVYSDAVIAGAVRRIKRLVVEPEWAARRLEPHFEAVESFVGVVGSQLEQGVEFDAFMKTVHQTTSGTLAV